MQVSEPDAAGNLSLGIATDFALSACRMSPLVVAEVNPHMPFALGDCHIHVDQVHRLVPVSYELPTLPIAPTPDDESIGVAAAVAEIVPDEATIEIGLGSVMSSVASALADHKNLGLHTGLLTDPLMALIVRGAITNSSKGIDRGVSVANQARGTRLLYDFIDRNPLLSMRPASYTHDVEILKRLRRFFAINSALEVDLQGRVNSEFINGKRVASSGGLRDFAGVASRSQDGRSVIALRSTTTGGVSRIVADLASAGTVSLSSDSADLVITEYGAADLRGKSADARAKAIISIAHPVFRKELASYAIA